MSTLESRWVNRDNEGYVSVMDMIALIDILIGERDDLRKEAKHWQKETERLLRRLQLAV